MTFVINSFLILIFFSVFGYLVGSIPFGLILTKSSGLGDIRNITKDKYGIKLDDKILQRLSIILAKKVSTLEMEYSKYIKEFERRKIKFLFKEDGCYSSSVIPISAANLNGIKTIEFQHGLITKTHEAYNLPLSIIKPPIEFP